MRLIYACLEICAENLISLHPLVARLRYLSQGLATETASLFLYTFIVIAVIVSECIQTFTSATRRC